MYLSSRSIRVRNLAVALVNGLITLIILLIAPLGLAAVLINTALVTLATYFTAIAADWVVRYLQPQQVQAEMMGTDKPSARLRRRQSASDLSDYD